MNTTSELTSEWMENVAIRTGSGGSFDCPPDWCWQCASMPDYDLWLVCRGNGRLACNGDYYDVSSGDCFLFRPGDGVSAWHEPDTPLLVLARHFEVVSNTGNAVTCPDMPVRYRHLPDPTFMQALMERGTTREADTAFWVAACLKELSGPIPPSRQSGNSEETDAVQMVRNAASRVARTPSGCHVVKALAKEAGMCPDHFSRVFRAAHGIPPQEFIARARVAHVKGLLLESNHSIARIAELAGYGSLSHLSRTFKHRTGKTPTEFRQTAVSESGAVMKATRV